MIRRSGVPRAWRAVAVGTVIAALVSGCGFTGVGDLPLPLRAGTGSGSFTVHVEMQQVANLVPNAEVKVNDVTVGTITKVRAHNWLGELTVGLDPGTVLPANATAKVAQKSLLGAEYLELAPPVGQAPVGQLRDGDLIGLGQTSRYPETEEVLAALSFVLNGSGLQQVRDITIELNRLLNGHETDTRSLIANLQTFVGALNSQRDDITHAIDGLNRLSGTLNSEQKTINDGLDSIPPALAALNSDRQNLIRGLQSLAHFGDVASGVINESRADLLGNLRSLQPALQKLADSGNDLTGAIPEAVTFPFPATTSFDFLKGDYGNLLAVVDVGPTTLARNLLYGFQALPAAPALLRAPPLGAGSALASPLAPFLPQGGARPAPAGPPPGLLPAQLPLLGGGR